LGGGVGAPIIHTRSQHAGTFTNYHVKVNVLSGKHGKRTRLAEGQDVHCDQTTFFENMSWRPEIVCASIVFIDIVYVLPT
jgi:hypothetical protein